MTKTRARHRQEFAANQALATYGIASNRPADHDAGPRRTRRRQARNIASRGITSNAARAGEGRGGRDATHDQKVGPVEVDLRADFGEASSFQRPRNERRLSIITQTGQYPRVVLLLLSLLLLHGGRRSGDVPKKGPFGRKKVSGVSAWRLLTHPKGTMLGSGPVDRFDELRSTRSARPVATAREWPPPGGEANLRSASSRKADLSCVGPGCDKGAPAARPLSLQRPMSEEEEPYIYNDLPPPSSQARDARNIREAAHARVPPLQGQSDLLRYAGEMNHAALSRGVPVVSSSTSPATSGYIQHSQLDIQRRARQLPGTTRGDKSRNQPSQPASRATSRCGSNEEHLSTSSSSDTDHLSQTSKHSNHSFDAPLEQSSSSRPTRRPARNMAYDGLQHVSAKVHRSHRRHPERTGSSTKTASPRDVEMATETQVQVAGAEDLSQNNRDFALQQYQRFLAECNDRNDPFWFEHSSRDRLE